MLNRIKKIYQMKSNIVSSFNIFVYGLICVFVYISISFFNLSETSLPCKELQYKNSDAALKYLKEVIDREDNAKEDTCSQLLNKDGRINCLSKNSSSSRIKICPIQKSFWQPRGCNLLNYHTREIAECMQNIPSTTMEKEILMLGDSRVRHLYMTLKSELQNKKRRGDEPKLFKEKYEDAKTGLTLNYIYRPLTDNTTIEHLREIVVSKQRPILLLIGNALHGIMHTEGSLEGLISYRKNFTEMVPLLENLTHTTTVIWMIQSPVVKAYLGITNLMIQLYNSVAVELLKGTHVHLMHSARSIGIATLGSYLDDPHLGLEADKMIVEIILNYLCNKHVTTPDKNLCCQK